MLNVGYGSHKDPYCYPLKPDRSFERVKNDRYDPSARPDPWPADCHHAVSSDCIPCRHFGWCDLDRHARQKLHRCRINRSRVKKKLYGKNQKKSPNDYFHILRSCQSCQENSRSPRNFLIVPSTVTACRSMELFLAQPRQISRLLR